MAKFQAFFQTVPVLPLSRRGAKRCARLRETLKRSGKRVNSRALDLILAATAIEYKLALVTPNTDDFDDIPGPKLADPGSP